MLTVSFVNECESNDAIHVYCLFENETAEIDQSSDHIEEILSATNFVGADGTYETFIHVSNEQPHRCILLGLGERESFSNSMAEKAGAGLIDILRKERPETVIVHFPKSNPASHVGAEHLAHFALGARLQSYRFRGYKKASDTPIEVNLILLTDQTAEVNREHKRLNAVAEGVEWARDLVMTPPNRLYPASFANELSKLSDLGVSATIYDEKDLDRKGFAALTAVGQGSSNPPRLVVMEWAGTSSDHDPLLVVGKGVTFDSGGHWLKPAKILDLMKFDMAGAAAVAGLMHTVARRGAKANVVGIVALAENMLDGQSYRPGDVIESLSGKTIEVINTDAEGRVVLADALAYASTAYSPHAVIDLATLTGAIVTALGSEYAGLFSNDETLAASLINVSLDEAEKLWRMPLDAAYDAKIDTEIADVKNLASPGLMGLQDGAPIIAAQFLQRFVGNNPWAHLDIAGTAWLTKGKPGSPKGATGFGVRLLNRFVETHLEKEAETS